MSVHPGLTGACREAAKMVLLLPLAVPRLALIVLLMLLVAANNTIASVGCDLKKPLPPRRRWMVEFVSTTMCGAILRVMGFRLSVNGWKNYKQAKERGVMVRNADLASYPVILLQPYSCHLQCQCTGSRW